MATPEQVLAAAVERQRKVQQAQREVAAEIAAERAAAEEQQGRTVPAGEPELERG